MSRDRGNRVFVGRLPSRIKERDLENFFRGFGRIRDINLKTGFAFVEFVDEQDAEDAVYELNHKELCEERVTVEHAHPSRGGGGGGGGSSSGGGGGGGGSSYGGRGEGGGGGRGRSGGFSRFGSPYNTEYRVIVENLSTRAGWQDLKDFMRQAGEVTFSQCHKDRIGEGVVDFASGDDLRRAIKKLDGSELLGKRIRLVENVRSSSRRRSRSASPYHRKKFQRSRSRSPRRSLSPRRSASPSSSRRRSKSPRVDNLAE